MTYTCTKSSHELSLTINDWTLYNNKRSQPPPTGSNRSLPLALLLPTLSELRCELTTRVKCRECNQSEAELGGSEQYDFIFCSSNRDTEKLCRSVLSVNYNKQLSDLILMTVSRF